MLRAPWFRLLFPTLMGDRPVEQASTTEGLPLGTSLAPTLAFEHVKTRSTLLDRRAVGICGAAIVLAGVAAIVAQVLKHLIWMITGLAFHGRLGTGPATPWDHHLGLWVVLVPIAGAVIVGLMARFGSSAIRGHGIPEAMEQVLTNKSRIPARMTWLKPLSAAISIGTGGPFGAEGPIIATGGALGSLIGQVLSTTASERKTLLAAGAAAGMAATFGSPVSAVLLAIELLLFEFRPASIVPVALGSAVAAGIRIAFEGTEPMFAMGDLTQPSGAALALYILAGALVGVAAVYVTRAVYAIEDAFEHIPLHWMWWPAIGAVAVGVVGYFEPRTLGVGYTNISEIISNHLTIGFVVTLCVLKFVSWSISLGSGTSGGTLAPLFTIGGGLGALIGVGLGHLFPAAQVDVRVAALVGMAAIFAGASRALLASVVFAFETTLQPLGLLPLLGGCTAAYLVSCLLMRQTIMTEKIARRGVRVPAEYGPDFLESLTVQQAATLQVITLRADDRLDSVRAWIVSHAPGSAHQGFPVVDGAGHLVGVVTRRDLLQAEVPGDRPIGSVIRRPPIVVYADSSLREALDHMVRHDVGRLAVIARDGSSRLVGIITRSDLLAAHRRRLDELNPDPPLRLRRPGTRTAPSPA